MTSFFSIKLNSFEMTIFNFFSSSFSVNSSIDFNASKYPSYSLKELALLAKTCDDAKEEFINRNLPRVNNFIKKYKQMFHIAGHTNLFETGLKSLLSIIDSFDARKGDINHFITFALKRSIRFQCMKIKREEKRFSDYFGSKIEIEEIDQITSCLSEVSPKKVANLVDFSTYTKKLNKIDKTILFLYLRGESFTFIAKITKLSVAAVSIKLKVIFNRIKKHYKNLDFNYISKNL